MVCLPRNLLLTLIVTSIPTVTQCQNISSSGVPTYVPSMVPSSGLIEGANTSAPTTVLIESNTTEVPSSVPITTDDEVVAQSSSIPSSVPVNEEVEMPSLAPVPLTLVPVTVGTPTVPPVSQSPVVSSPTAPKSDLCELNEACAALNLTGQCCPTIDEQFLHCCNGMIEPTCQQNNKCAALGLEGACCPTSGNIPSNLDGIYLDCCTTVPDECATERQGKRVGGDNGNETTTETDAPSSCVRMSSVEYKEALNEFNMSSAAFESSLSFRSVMMVFGTVAVVVVTTMM